MNDRIQKFEELITRPDNLIIDDIFSEKQRESNQIEQLITLNPQQAYQLSTSIQAQYESLNTGIKDMRNHFGKSVSEVLKEKPDAAKLQPYLNVLPYGLEDGIANPNRGDAKPTINAGLENLDPSLTKHAHLTYSRIFHRMFPDTYKQLKTEIFENYGNSSVRESDIDGLCLNHIFSSAIGSMFDWTSIDPKSVGMGSIEHITDLFQKYYFGEIDEKKPNTPWEEKPSDYRKYTSGGGNVLEIQGDKFYDDFINGSFFRHCLQGYISKTKTAPTTFDKRIEGFYDFNPELWFDNEDAAAAGNGKTFKNCDPDKHCDSYGNFFKVKQPVKISDAVLVVLNDPRVKGSYTAATTPWETALTNAAAKKNEFTGMYNTYEANASNTFILTNESKPLCCLFHKGAIRDREFVAAPGAIAQRIFTVPILTDFDFRTATTELASYGSGTDNGPDMNSILAGANASINQVAQLLYNSKSVGFHLTPGNANASTSLVAGTTHTGIQMITGYSCGKLTGAANTYINDNANIATATAARVAAVALVLALSQVAGVGYFGGGAALNAVHGANSIIANAPADLAAARLVATALALPAVITAITGVSAVAEAARVAALASVNAYIAVSGAGVANTCGISNGASPAAATAAAVYTNLIGAAANGGVAPDAAAITPVLSKESYQFIPLTTLMKGGNHIKSHSGSGKHKTDKVKSPPIKKVSKAKLPSSKKDKKDKKQNPVKKVKKRITKQKGGAEDNFFNIRDGTPAGGGAPPSLDASRRPVIISKPIFENYRKALTEYIKRFGSGMNPNKIQDILTKLTNITHLGIFYHGPDDTLNFGGDAGTQNNIKFEDLGEMFLYCSVITNTIKLMIHFFKNIKACILHFIKTELEMIISHINNKLKVVNTTNISSANVSYFEKYIAGCEELNKNIDNLINFLKNNTMCLGEPKSNGAAPAAALAKNEQFVINLFFGANIHRQDTTKVGGPPMGADFAKPYPIEFYTFHHDLINFFSSSERTFKKLNTMKFQKTLRILTGNNIVLNNGYDAKSATADTYPKDDYSITKASFGGIPMTFGNNKPTHYSWMTFMFLLTYREKSNEQLGKDNILEINQSLSQISSQDKLEIKKKVIETYKGIRPIIADPKIDLGSKNKILQKVFFSFFEESNAVAKKIMEDHSAIEQKSKRVNIRNKTTITNIIQRRHLGPAESGRVLIIKEIEIQQLIRKFSYKVDCLVNLLHAILIASPHGSDKNYTIFMYAISRLRNFVYRLYYLNKTYYIENETTKKLLLLESGFDLSKNSKNSKTPDKKKTFELFTKLTHTQLKDQNSDTEDWWKIMEQSFRDRTTEVHGKYFRLFTYVLMDNEVFLVDIFSMATSAHSIKSYSEILKKDVQVYTDHHGHEIYSPNNMLIKLQTDFTKDTKYKKLLKGELYFEYMKNGSKPKKKILEPIFIQGSTVEQLKSILRDNFTNGKPAMVLSTKSETSFQIYKIQKHAILNARAFRSWAYDLLFSMPTRIDVDDSYFKLHIQTSVNTIPSLAKSQILPSLVNISRLNKTEPIVQFQSRVRINNNAKLLMNNNIQNKDMDSYVRYISREQIILLGLVFGDSLH